MKAEHQSSVNRLTVIDSLITHNQIKDAEKELKKLSKKTYDIWTLVGVYKRYIKIDDKKSAEKILVQTIKKNPENLEIKSLYTDFLLKQNRVDEACKVSKALSGTKYGSLYSEAILKKAIIDNASENSFINFTSEDFVPIFFDAYNSSGNSFWLRNCAIINLMHGKNKEAVSVVPASYYEVTDAYFWSLIFYDVHKYDLAIEAIEASKKLLRNYENKKSFRVDIADLIALESDCYIMLNDYESAENYRQELITGITETTFAKDNKKILPAIYLNSALFAIENNNLDNAVDLLFIIVNNWPDFIPGLMKYADLAYELSIEREDDLETKILKEAGIKSLEMERYENRRKIPVSDALYRLQNIYSKTKNQQVQLKLLDMRFKTEKDLSRKFKTVEIWKLLEDNITEGLRYTDEIVEYALSYFIESKLYPESFELFSKYMITQYDFNADDDFYTQIYLHRNEINQHLMEFAAWFALVNNQYSAADQLYKCCLMDYFNNDDDQISPFISYSAVMNYANIRCSYGDKIYARDLYVKLAARERKVSNKAEIFYRLANIYVNEGDIQNAKRAVDYAVTLYPDNAKAQLLKVKLSN